MITPATGLQTSDEPVMSKASKYRHIIRSLMDKLECGVLCLKSVPIIHNGGRHSILVRDLSRDNALGELIQAGVDRFRRLKDVEITLSRDEVPREQRSNYSYILVVQQGGVKSELP